MMRVLQQFNSQDGVNNAGPLNMMSCKDSWAACRIHGSGSSRQRDWNGAGISAMNQANLHHRTKETVATTLNVFK